jgi:hypothetical protein
MKTKPRCTSLTNRIQGLYSGSVRTVRDKYDPHRVLGSIERLKRKWFSPAEKFRVFQQYRPFSASHETIFRVSYGEIRRSTRGRDVPTTDTDGLNASDNLRPI